MIHGQGVVRDGPVDSSRRITSSNISVSRVPIGCVSASRISAGRDPVMRTNVAARRSARLMPASAWAVLLAGLCVTSASGQMSRSTDEIQGDPLTGLHWSEGSWSRQGNPLPGCITFAGGVDTGAGQESAADTVECADTPDQWSWNVTVPGPFTLYYEFRNIPPGFMLCGQVFSSDARESVVAQVDAGRMWTQYFDASSGTLIWEGPAGAPPGERAGLQRLAAQRCGRIALIQELGACCLEDGSCVQVAQEECPNDDWLRDVPCEPDPCPHPNPVEGVTWGRIKGTYGSR